MKNVLIEGWRGINHSFALVNQYQLLALARMGNLRLRHRDLPFLNPAWNPIDNDPGFSADDKALLESIPAPGDEEFDAAYSIGWPVRLSNARCRKALTFFVTEFGPSPSDFAAECRDIEPFVRGDNSMVVPSNWARMKLIEFGFPSEKVKVVPHGVDPAAYGLPLPEHREFMRRTLGVGPDDFLFLNLGAMTWNKGIDVLVKAFAAIRARHPNARLVLKDQKKLYGVGAESMLQKLMEQSPGLVTEDVRTSIILITSTLTTPQMNVLYASADAYVSPYRAEGFNLPVIEAIASGTPAIVTAGGPTDDFCLSGVALKVGSTPVANSSIGLDTPGFHLEPQLDSLIAHMEAMIARKGIASETFRVGREQLLRNFSWSACTARLAELF
jgi:glycosyltransferase involved in cell wall biosynthesis